MKDYADQLRPLRAAMSDFAEAPVRAALEQLLVNDCVIHMAHPFGDLHGPEDWYQSVYHDLFTAIPDLERRDFILAQGQSLDFNGTQSFLGDMWVGCAGHYVGTFRAPWLDIPATGHFVHMRFHEFYRFVGEQVVEIQALWDIPELMQQANAWPMTPALGRDKITFGPASQDGLQINRNGTLAKANQQLVLAMLEHLVKYPSQGGPEIMEMPRFWHSRCNWYGPAGVGACRGISGFRRWHQTPFLAAMPDRGQDVDGLKGHFFADGNYVAVTGWPNMRQTITHDGWLGIAPVGQSITLCSLDFWRIQDGLIRENWVLFDLLDIYQQLGVDVLARMRAFNQARVLGPTLALST